MPLRHTSLPRCLAVQPQSDHIGTVWVFSASQHLACPFWGCSCIAAMRHHKARSLSCWDRTHRVFSYSRTALVGYCTGGEGGWRAALGARCRLRPRSAASANFARHAVFGGSRQSSPVHPGSPSDCTADNCCGRQRIAGGHYIHHSLLGAV